MRFYWLCLQEEADASIDAAEQLVEARESLAKTTKLLLASENGLLHDTKVLKLIQAIVSEKYSSYGIFALTHNDT